MFKKATKEASFARIALAGPSGAGKTYTALAIGTHLADSVAVIDTERGSASKYVGLNGWEFDTAQPDSFSPLSLVGVLAEAAGNYGCVIIDSLSHYWMGTDGMLEQVDRKAKGGASFSGWKEVRPDERRMLDALVSFPGHVIVTMRSKTEYVIEENDKGKKVPRKVGLKPDQREGIEYEFDLVGDLDHASTLTVTKSRIHTLAKAVVPLPGEDFAREIGEWLSDGVRVPTAEEYRKQALMAASADELLALLAEVTDHRLAGAPTLTEDGRPTVLGDLIKARGRSLRAQEREAPSAEPTPDEAKAAVQGELGGTEVPA